MDRRKPVAGPRKVWRITSEAPLGEIVDLGARSGSDTRSGGKGDEVAPIMMIDTAPVANWRASSYDLLSGLEVTDQSDSIPGELFDELFNR